MRSDGIVNTCLKEPITEEVADGRYSLHAVLVTTADGISIYLGGGESPHIGTVVISQPRPSLRGDGQISCTTSVFNLIAHKDDSLAIPLAEELCKKHKQVVVVTAGVHIDNAEENDIARLGRNSAALAAKLMARMVNKV
ncbi:MAG: hypothetical protein RIN56_17790 [Sporomusaceae bacterium]|nr:hypothetical protein [Sporomusaceae bacterium]